ncbi:hypothetical protein M0Q97_00150 [Candidatus Dojkabacteria bacterium]|jgi:hypothetical protein|nr:hypothetical protein [Candidatus Dojkabacteria bacterium]
MVNIGVISKPLSCRKSKFAPVNSELSIKNPVINILSKNVIPIVTSVDIRRYVRKFTLIVRKFKKGLVIITPILKTIKVAMKYTPNVGITTPEKMVVVK